MDGNFLKNSVILLLIVSGCAANTTQTEPGKSNQPVQNEKHASFNEDLERELSSRYDLPPSLTKLRVGEQESERTLRLVDLREQLRIRDSQKSKSADKSRQKPPEREPEPLPLTLDIGPNTVGDSNAHVLPSQTIEKVESKPAPIEDTASSKSTPSGQELFKEFRTNPEGFFDDHSGLVEAFGSLGVGCKIDVKVYGSSGRNKSACLSFQKVINDQYNISIVSFIATIDDLVKSGDLPASGFTFSMKQTLKNASDGFQAMKTLSHL